MSELKLEINTKNLERAIRLFPKELKYKIADGMDHATRKFLKIFKQTRLQGPPGIKGRPHGIFTHFSRASLLSQDIEGMGMVIFSDSKIARMHEQGATLKNPGGGKLAVPLSARKELFTSDGRLKKQYKQPRLLKNVIPIQLKGKTFLAKVKKKLRELIPIFVLKNSVRIRPRLMFYKTWDDMQNERIDILNKSIEKALNKV
ncbi:hypothetical protein BU251_09235 [Candidatus Velamenicoccus archaeovorus]|uniref:Uncharacterized protein n=2 Tax=Velamenicoccus archaeovorus TaxID=1930593 RepID=A0A410P7F3_VELA1|nr:hypothetical protein BU251_09235 [Candidatus Velamenicoccus archaeovorus]